MDLEKIATSAIVSSISNIYIVSAERRELNVELNDEL